MSWSDISNSSCKSEGDVETRILFPFCELLGFQKSEIHSKVPVTFREGKKGRKHEADIVVSENDPRTHQSALFVIEAKAPGEELGDGSLQADSYAHALNSPFFIVSNDEDFQIWQKGVLSKSKLVFEIKISNLANDKEKIKALLSKKAIQTYLESCGVPDVKIESLQTDLYIKQLKRELEVDFFYPRTLFVKEENASVEYSGEEDLFKSNRGIVLNALGGRGKTTILKMLLGQMWLSKEKRLPLYISMNKSSKSIIEEAFEKVSLFTKDLDNKDSFCEWIKKSNIILGIDNWEELDSTKNEKFFNELMFLESLGAKFVLAKRPNVSCPAIKFLQYDVENYNKDDVGKIIRRFFVENSKLHRFPAQALNNIPDGIQQLLQEPVILGKYLELLTLSESKISEPPCGLASLMNELIQSSVKSRNFDLKEKLIEIYSVCGKLALLPDRQFDLEAISEYLVKSNLSEKASTAVVDYCNIGIFNHSYGDQYSFSHDIWRVYFKYQELINAWKIRPLDELIAKIDSIDENDFKLVWPFLVGSISSSTKQDELFQSLLEKPMLYLSALRWRSPASFDGKNLDDVETWCLKQFRSGYFDPLNCWMPRMKSFLGPWNRLSKSQRNTASDNLKYVGDVGDANIHFMKIMDDSSAPNIILIKDIQKYFDDPKKLIQLSSQFKNLSLSGYGKDSGRRSSMEDLLNEIEKALDKGNLPLTKWVATEKFIGACKSIRPKVKDKSFEELTPRLVKKWVDDEVSKISVVNGRKGGVTYGFSGVSTEDIEEFCDFLINIDLGESKLKELELPGPDIDKGGYYGELYTDEQKKRRLTLFYEAVYSTYLEVCEKFFPLLKQYFFYRYFPLNIVVRLSDKDRAIGPWGSSYEYYYQPSVEGSGCIFEDSPEPSIFRDQFEKMALSFEEKGIFDLSGLSVGATAGEWNPTEPVIIKEVCEMLKNDFDKLKNEIK